MRTRTPVESMKVTAVRSRTSSRASWCCATASDSRGTVARSTSPLTVTVATAGSHRTVTSKGG
jgi:hypothetical protein